MTSRRGRDHEDCRGEAIPWSSWWAFWRLGGVGPRGMVCMYVHIEGVVVVVVVVGRGCEGAS